MKVVLVAGDFAQSEVLKMLGEALEKKGHKVGNFLAYGETPIFNFKSIKEELVGADWLISGMSEHSNEEVVVVKEAMEKNVKIALYADTFDAHKLPAFGFARKEKLRLFVINDGEVEDARKLFPNADVIVTGNPRWEEFFSSSPMPSAARAVLDITEDKKVILCVGDKYLAQNILQFGATIDAIQKLGWENKVKLFFALHPGDTNDYKFYYELVRHANCDCLILDGPDETDKILSVSDLVIEFTSTVGIKAACLRLPVIDFCSTIAMRGKKPVEGVSPWKLAEYGATEPIYYGSSTDLAKAMLNLEVTSFHQRRNQEKMFPKPDSSEPGSAIQKMCEALK